MLHTMEATNAVFVYHTDAQPILTDVGTTDDCSIDAQPSKQEWELPVISHRRYSFHIEDALIRQYCIDASRMRSAGAPATQVMQEVYDLIIEGANIVMKAINVALVTSPGNGVR